MKNLKFNFKSIVQNKARWLLTLIAILTLGVGQMWAYDMYIYCCPEDVFGASWNSANGLQLNCARAGSNENPDDYHLYDMSQTAWTKDGKAIYCAHPEDLPHQGMRRIEFKNGSNYSGVKYSNWMSDSETNTFFYGSWQALSKDNYVSGGYVYFDNSANLLSNSYRYFVVGHNSYSKVYPLTQLANTNLWYADMSGENWPDATYCAFVSPTSEWESKTWGPSNIANADKHTGTMTVNYSNPIESGKYYLYSGTSSTLSRTIYTAVTGLNRTQTVNIYTSTNRGSTYSSSATGGSVKVDRYYMNSSATEASHATEGSATVLSSASNTTGVVLTSDASFTGVANTGYTFVGWSSNTTAPSPDDPDDWEIDGVSAANTKYAFFRRNHYDLSYSPSTPVSGDHFTWYTKPTDADYGTTVTFKVTPASGYEMEAGYPTATYGVSSSVTVSPTGNANEYSFTMPASDVTIAVSMVPSDVTLTAKVVAGYNSAAHGSIQVDSEDAIRSTSGENYTISYNTEVTFTADPDDYYHVKDWLVDGVSQGVSTSTFAYTLTANTTVSVEYAPDVYNITYKNTPSAALPAGTTHSNPATYTCEDLVSLSDPTLAGTTFHGWYRKYNSTLNYHSEKTGTYALLRGSHGDTTFYAHWTRVRAFEEDMVRSTFYQGEPIEVKLDVETESGGDRYASSYSKCFTLLNEDGSEASRQPFFDTITYSTFSSFTADVIGTYKLKVELIPDNGGCDGAVAATAISSPFTIEPTQTVLVQFYSDGKELMTQRTYTTSANALQLTLNANKMGVDTGFVFSSWEKGSHITLREGSTSTATITLTADARDTLKVNYNTGGIFFKNTLGWDEVYMYRHTGNSYWNASQGTGSKGGIFTKMTKVKNDPTGDIYYVACSHTNGDVVSFVNQNQGNYESYTNYQDNTQVVYRTDYNSYLPLFIPVSTNPKTDSYVKNSCYYIRGFWTKYHPNTTGYKLGVYTAKSDGSEVESEDFTFGTNGNTLTATVNLEASKNLGFCFTQATSNSTFNVFRNTGDYAYNTGKLNFDSGDGLCGLATKAAGDYIVTIDCRDNYDNGTEGNKVQGRFEVSVTYPAKDGDYRLVYRQGAGKEGKSSVNTDRPTGWYHESDIIPAETVLNYREVYIDPAAEPELKLQQYTISSNTWADVDKDITFTDENGDPYEGISSLEDLPEKGVYQFMVNTKAGNVSINYRGKYDGDFYIRTNGTDKYKWDYKKSPYAHRMTYSEYSSNLENKPFTHYYVKDLEANTNVRFTVATENTSAICDTIYNNDGVNNFDQEKVPGFANVRFMYNEKTNCISRAVLGASTAADFLNIQALTSEAKLYKNSAGNVRLGNKNITIDASSVSVDTLKFTDRGNWIYEATVYAKPGATIKLTAQYSSVTQYFKGKEGAFNVTGNVDTLIGGTGSNVYPIHITYDYKINRLLTAWQPDTLKENLAINADLMLVREHQKDAEQVILGKTTQYTLSKVKTVYGTMHFNKWTLNNKSKVYPHPYLYGEDNKSEHERGMYLISFPFDVDLIDVFGFGEYGRHWIIEYYDGKGRAKNGYWIDSEPNWKFVTTEMRDTFKLNANEGYVLALDLDYFGEYSNIWQYVEDIYLYFPSTADIGTITSTNKTINFLNQSAYKCEIKRNKRDIKDSYWHCIGVPSFANANHRIGTDYDESGYVPFPNIESWSSTDLPFVYTWHMEDNTFEPMKAAPENFKATHAYLVQYSKDTMLWRSVNNAPDPVLAPVMARQNNRADYDLQVELWKGETKQDQTLLRLSDDANVTSAFEFNYDLCKENNAGVANLWTMTSDEIEVAGNSMPYGDQSTIIPVGVKINTSGDYTFAIPEGTDGVGVVLLDNVLNTRTNLALTNYTVNLASGTINGRFYLEISPISQSPTGINLVVRNQDLDVRKIMIDGVLYIVKDGEIFDARGIRVK